MANRAEVSEILSQCHDEPLERWPSAVVVTLAESYLDLLDKFERVTTCR